MRAFLLPVPRIPERKKHGTSQSPAPLRSTLSQIYNTPDFSWLPNLSQV